jgi:hypothetical protein
MTRLLRRLGAAASVALSVAGAACPAGALGRESKPLELTIAFTGDVSGYLEPCG